MVNILREISIDQTTSKSKFCKPKHQDFATHNVAIKRVLITLIKVKHMKFPEAKLGNLLWNNYNGRRLKFCF